MIELPGRPPEEEDIDHEAINALDELFRAENVLKDSNAEMLDRIEKQIVSRKEKLDSILQRMDRLEGEEEDEDEDEEGEISPTGSLSDFVNRMKKDRMIEDFKTQENPLNRRLRIANRKPKMSGPRLLVKFS